jgi:hypothetical protein
MANLASFSSWDVNLRRIRRKYKINSSPCKSQCECFVLQCALVDKKFYNRISINQPRRNRHKRAAHQGIIGCSEMEFLDIKLTKESILLLHTTGYMVPGERPGVRGKVGGNVLHDSQPLVGRALHNHLRGL